MSRYQLRILQPLNRIILKQMAQNAEVLSELLGSEHDLDFLRRAWKTKAVMKRSQTNWRSSQNLITKRCKRLRRD